MPFSQSSDTQIIYTTCNSRPFLNSRSNC